MTERDAAWYQALFDEVSNWGRWGENDERGTLNLLTPERTAAAAGLIRSGRTVSAALDLDTRAGPGNPVPAQHHMLTAGDARGDNPLPGFEQSTDFVGIACHGMATTHVDALCHIFVDGRMYNGFPAGDVLSRGGARRNSIMAQASTGLCGRGVLLDIPALRGVPWLEPGEAIMPAELEAAEAKAGVKVQTGDLVLISTGRTLRARRGERTGMGLAGLDADCIRWLHQREVAVLGSDAVSDVMGPDLLPGWAMPVHQCCIAGMGMPLIDNVDLAVLADACAHEGRWAFWLTVAPLRVPGATGCAVNPIAVF